jgi:hypothetical protein
VTLPPRDGDGADIDVVPTRDAVLKPDTASSLESQVRKASVRTGLFGGGKAGPTIGRFRVESKLGEGGMGAVYEAWDEDLGRAVAVKVLSRATAGENTVGRARLLREAKAMARLSHPNVVTVHEVGESEFGVFVAMELVRGQTLRDWLAVDRRVDEILDAFAQAGAGLAAAHAIGLAHRDFKPDNAIVGEDGRVRVLDFGLARDASSPEDLNGAKGTEGSLALGVDLTRTGTIMGTPAYMAPEQFLCESTDPRTDQFAYCVALWEALDGRRPFAGQSFEELRDAVVNGRRVSSEGIPLRLRPVLERGLSTGREDRYSSMDALLDAMRPPASKRRRGRAAGLILTGIGVTAAAVFASQFKDAAMPPPSCTPAVERVAQLWNAELRARGAKRFEHATLAHVPATWLSIERQVNAWTDAWAKDYDAFCAKSNDPGTVALAQMSCAETQLRWLDTYLEVLALEDPVAVAADFNGELPFWHELTFCRDERAVVSQPPPMDDPELEEVAWGVRRGLLSATVTRSEEGVGEFVADADRLVDRAEALGVDSIRAEAAYLRGFVAALAGEDDADARLESAALLAAASRHDWVASAPRTRGAFQ